MVGRGGGGGAPAPLARAVGQDGRLRLDSRGGSSCGRPVCWAQAALPGRSAVSDRVSEDAVVSLQSFGRGGSCGAEPGTHRAQTRRPARRRHGRGGCLKGSGGRPPSKRRSGRAPARHRRRCRCMLGRIPEALKLGGCRFLWGAAAGRLGLMGSQVSFSFLERRLGETACRETPAQPSRETRPKCRAG